MNHSKNSTLKPEVSIIILTKNAQQYLDEILLAIYDQITDYSFEVIIVDSGSTDRTHQIADKYPVRLHSIQPSDFSHGLTRNLGGELSHPDSQYLVYLTHDATPTENWLNNLIRPFEQDENIAGVFSRHIPRPDCNPSLMRQITEDWPQAGTMERVIKRIDDPLDFEQRKGHYVYFANTSSCLRRSVWDTYPFAEVDFAEDMDWAERVLLAGYTLIYEPGSAVLHSHNYPLIEHCRQNFDHARAMRERLGDSFQPPTSKISRWLPSFIFFKVVQKDLKVFWNKSEWPIVGKLYWTLYSVLWHGAESCGYSLAASPKKVSDFAERWFSRQKRIKNMA